MQINFGLVGIFISITRYSNLWRDRWKVCDCKDTLWSELSTVDFDCMPAMLISVHSYKRPSF